MKNRRYSDQDRHFWPFTWSKVSHNAIGATINSGEKSSDNCHLILFLWSRVLICELPRIIKPHTRTVNTANGSYDDVHPQEFGLKISDDFYIQVSYGPQTWDSLTEKRWSMQPGFMQYRFFSQAWYHDDILLRVDYEKDKIPFRSVHEFKDSMPKTAFEFLDYDGKLIVANCYITVRTWKHGYGWFKWLSWFKSPLVKKSLEIEFSEEVGPDKGSWKGGTRGHGIEMLENETAEEVFKRYCETEHSAKHNKSFKLKYLRQVKF